MIPNVLSVAGSDPSGGAGIQADLKTFSALGCYGMAAMTALTAQNTKGVTDVHEVPAKFVAQQIEAIFADIRVDTVKIGMAGSVQTIELIADILQRHKPSYVVLDPVMVSTSGSQLISDEAIDALKHYLIPLCDVLTPNIPEAKVLLGTEFNLRNMKENAKKLMDIEARAVLIKGGHRKTVKSTDIYMDRYQTLTLEATRVKTKNTHGTGCTLSSAIAAYLAKGLPEAPACQAAKKYVTKALRASEKLKVGKGHGPVHHFHALWD